MAADDIEVIHMTAVEWDQALTNSLSDLGLTWEQLTEQAKAGDFTSSKARQLWLMAAGQGPNHASVEVERLQEALEDAYAERDQQFERKVAALRERDEAKQQLAEAQRTIAAYERHINDMFETNRRNLQKARDQRDEAQDERDALKAAIYDTRIAHIRTVHPSRIIVDDCGECRAFVALGLATPAKPDDLDELCRRLAALDAPTGTP